MIHSFLMAGQSNIAGRGFLNEVPLIYNERIKMLRNGKWQTMVEPINYDRPTSGISLAGSFAAAWCLKNKSENIGLIPCADGGSSLDDWAIDGILFEHAVLQAKLAQKTSKLDGILWHQGENDANPDAANRYEEKFSLIVQAFRRELNEPDLPIVIGGLGDFLIEGMYGAYFSAYPVVNKKLKDCGQSIPHCYFVTALGLTSNPDVIHFNAASQRIFGVRYFEAFANHMHVLEPLKTEGEILEMIEQRPLSETEKKELLNLKFSSGALSLEDYKIELSKL
ncbi:sialate O-acetylesterase [Pedobacter nototheniae]|uniref:sialate O-acetylesterase n=1 Tax=Pedobacter nototheniae TaxID=2488994 RepID=UPI00292D10D0|nr:sialate O-acetylesterase [Pedobacter nototheniae]